MRSETRVVVILKEGVGGVRVGNLRILGPYYFSSCSKGTESQMRVSGTYKREGETPKTDRIG